DEPVVFPQRSEAEDVAHLVEDRREQASLGLEVIQVSDVELHDAVERKRLESAVGTGFAEDARARARQYAPRTVDEGARRADHNVVHLAVEARLAEAGDPWRNVARLSRCEVT